jgi:hypothetical protein
MDCKLGFGENMKIATFGCSWTHGDGRSAKHKNWPLYLKKLMPHATIENYAVAGTSILWSVYQLQWVKKHNPADFYIFQMTRPERLTYWKDNTNWLSYRQDFYDTRTYNSYIYNAGVQIVVAQTATQKPMLNAQKPAIKLARSYFSVVNDEVMKLEYDLAVRYVKDNVNFYYMQTEAKENGYNDILCLEDEFGREYCEKYWEQGTHFGKKGLKRTAEWVKDNAGL